MKVLIDIVNKKYKGTRVCTNCGEEQPETKKYFYYDKDQNRFITVCIKCISNHKRR